MQINDERQQDMLSTDHTQNSFSLLVDISDFPTVGLIKEKS